MNLDAKINMVGFEIVEEIKKKGKDKTKYKYLLTDKGLEQKIAATKKFIKIKKAEYERLQEELKKYESN